MSIPSRSPEALAEAVLAGDERAAARLMRLADDAPRLAQVALTQLYAHTGRAHVIGVTGPPGSGKSTLVSGLVAEYRGVGARVGVVAVDPTSPFSGGALLGDRVRMMEHALDEGVFIRSLATRGALGGLSRSADDSVAILDALGCDVVLVETVGVGQSEVEVAQLAHTVMVVLMPGYGDDVQALKAGLLEVADVFVVNKADRAGASDVAGQLRGLRRLRWGGAGEAVAGWRPAIVMTTASERLGVAELVVALGNHREHLATTPAGPQRERERLTRVVLRLVEERVRTELLEGPLAPERLASTLEALSARETDPYTVAAAILQGYKSG